MKTFSKKRGLYYCKYDFPEQIKNDSILPSEIFDFTREYEVSMEKVLC